MSKRRAWQLLLGAFSVLFAAAQFVRPQAPALGRDPNARSVWTDPAVPEPVKTILRRSCADCHSSDTRWPWYAKIAPVSWVIERDVRRAREHMNLSVWPASPDVEEAEIGDMVFAREMPPKRYLLMHPDARLTDSERNLILKWSQSVNLTR